LFALSRLVVALLLLLTTLLTADFAQAQPQTGQRPNVLFFLVDDMGVGDCSVSFLHDGRGEAIDVPVSQRYRTPNIERLASQGVRFSQAYAYSVCTPTRVSLMTGQHAARHHVTTWTHPATPRDTGSNQVKRLRSPEWSKAGIRREHVTLPALLREAGYRTIHAGKAHFGSNGSFGGDPRNIGFDVNIAGHGAGAPGSYHGEHEFSAAWRGGGRIWDVPGLAKYHGQDIFLTEALTREMSGAIGDAVASEKPFFAYMAHYAVHAPFEIDERFRANYPGLKGKALAFATMVEGMDQSLGDLLERLDELGVAEETLVVFFSDNGSDGPLNKPLRGKKGTRFEGGLRVPLVIAWAKPDPEHPLQQRYRIQRGVVEDDLVVCEDLFATVAQAAGLELENGQELESAGGMDVELQVDGCDLSAYLAGIPGTHRPQRYLVHFPHGHNNDHFTAYREGPWKILYSYGSRRWELYDLNRDLSETNDLVEEKPELAWAMGRNLVAWLERYGAQLPVDVVTGEAEKPELTGLQQARKAQRAMPAPAPLARDDLDLAAMRQPVGPENIFRDPNWFTWCNSILRGEDGRYHLFYVRWPKRYGFHAWLTHSETARAVSSAPAGPYRHVETVIPSRGDFAWNQYNAHNVKIERFGDRYYLYHISNNDGGLDLSEDMLIEVAGRGYPHRYWMTLRNNQRTGVAIADSVTGPWRVLDRPIVEPGGPVSTVSVNPDVWRGQDGRYYMIYKGDYPGVGVAQALAIADSPEGPFLAQPGLVFGQRRSEDVSTWWDPKRKLHYGILHDLKGFGLLVSADDRSWQSARHYRVAPKRIEMRDAAVFVPDRYERPFVYVEEGMPRVLAGAVRKGNEAYIVLTPLRAQ
jgi:arylsulfatase A-like enzyme